MSLLGTFGRICYSAYFVVDGYRLATQPETYTGRMALGVGQVLPLVQDHLPPDVADRLPEDEESWVRILGITQVIAGVSLAAGFARRPSALLLALATIPRLVESADSTDRDRLLAPLALLGAGVAGAFTRRPA